jgi:osmotically-inducible protein OsmY
MQHNDESITERVLEGDGEAPKHGAIGCLSTDEALQQAVCAALIDSAQLDSSDVGVRVANGCVTLTGSVRDPRARSVAVQLAFAQSGVADVDTAELRVDGH